MGDDTPQQTREGSLIEAAAKATGLSVKKLSANAGISDTRWRHIVRGWQPGPGGSPNPVQAPALTLARMAFTVGVAPEQLAGAGRTDAAELLARMDASGADSAIPLPTGGYGTALDRRTVGGTETGVDEIELVYASRSMNPKQKLQTIQMILRLRAEVEAADDAGDRARKKAPAPDAEAPADQ